MFDPTACMQVHFHIASGSLSVQHSKPVNRIHQSSTDTGNSGCLPKPKLSCCFCRTRSQTLLSSHASNKSSIKQVKQHKHLYCVCVYIASCTTLGPHQRHGIICPTAPPNRANKSQHKQNLLSCMAWPCHASLALISGGIWSSTHALLACTLSCMTRDLASTRSMTKSGRT